MTLWSRSGSGYSTSSRWTEDPAMPMRKPLTEKFAVSSNPELPPGDLGDGDDMLPVPVQYAGSLGSGRKVKKSARIGGLTVHWARLRRRIGTATAPSSDSQFGESAAESHQTHGMGQPEAESDEVDEVVVDRVWTEDFKSSASHSEPAVSPEKSGSHQQFGTSERASTTQEADTLLLIITRRVWPAVKKFFYSSFADKKVEKHYCQEDWFLKKSLALWASVWLILNWILGCSFISPTWILPDQIFYFGIAPALSIPIGIMVMYDFPRDRPVFYQIVLTASIWSWSYYNVLYIYLCGFYGGHRHVFSCLTKDFLTTFYYTTALQTIALFGLKMSRLSATVGATVFFVFSCAAIIPDRLPWTRNMINFAVFQSFLIYVHYTRESSERRLFRLRDQLKIQFKATQKAQVNERRAADSKRRLTSCVRVPLNTALLAVQNMEASGTVAKDQEIEFSALSGSLSMMSKVLNDVLDFNRMDSGKFESASRPYAFHHVLRSLFVPLRLATDARGLEFITDLDPNVDNVARRAAYEAMGENADAITRHIQAHPDVDGVVIGDETRLRQIITNLASNACKFTPAGGKLIVSTRLMHPQAPAESEDTECTQSSQILEPIVSADQHHALSVNHLSQHNLHHATPPPPLERIVVRIEVTDTGYGIQPKDMVQGKLFSAFNQTEQGRQQGGKGTGLGLALVRQIVKLSGGRLGIKSKVGEGSTFWVELPLGVGRKTLIAAGSPDLEPDEMNVTDIEKLDASADEMTPLPNSMSNSVSMAVDAAALKASQVSPASTRSSSALHSLMEQGGRVELSLAKYGSNSPVLTRTIGDASTGTQVAPLPSPDSEILPSLKRNPPPSTLRSQNGERPTYVPLPSPRSFDVDETPTASTDNNTNATSNGHAAPASSSSVLTMFDQNSTRGNSSSASPAPVFDSGLNVLVVDDDSLTRTLMKRILTRLGCKVSTAENGEVALEMILGVPTQTPSSDTSRNFGPILEREQTGSPAYTEEGKYSIVFLDNQMPIMSGLTMVEKLRELGRKDFIVGVTGNALLTDQNEYLEAGVDKVLTKPVYERSLRDMLVIADERRKQRENALQRHTSRDMA